VELPIIVLFLKNSGAMQQRKNFIHIIYLSVHSIYLDNDSIKYFLTRPCSEPLLIQIIIRYILSFLSMAENPPRDFLFYSCLIVTTLP